MEEHMADALSQFSRHLASTIETASKTVVAVHGRGRIASSGIIWEPGLAVTAEETIERDTDLALALPDGRRVEATLVGRDASTDIAVLRFVGEAPAAAPTVASDLRPGHLAVAVGRSHGDVIAALGIVSYSVYLVHVPFLLLVMPRLFHAYAAWTLGAWATLLALFGGCVAVSTASYWGIERPFLLRKARIDW